MALPIHAKRGETRVIHGRSFWMSCDMTINEDRSINTKIRTWTREALAGFTGRCLATFRDGSGNIIEVQASPPYGVNGECIPFGSPSDRIDVWRSGLSVDDAAIVAKVEFEFWRNGPSFIKRLEDTLKQVKKGIDLFAEGTNHPNAPEFRGSGPLIG